MKLSLLVSRSSTAAALVCLLPVHAFAQPSPSGQALYEGRRAKLLGALDRESVGIIMSAKTTQDDIFEFFVPHADNHDFVYLTGLDGEDSVDSALLLCPGATQYRQILYTSGDVEAMKKRTGLEYVFPYGKFVEDLSEALTDFSLLRMHQRGAKPLTTDISRSLGAKKYVYFNYPRFVNLSTTPPGRLDLINKVRYFSPEVQVRDISDALDRLRMIHDDTEIELLRKASAIVVKAFVESMKTVRAGSTTRLAAAMVDYMFATEHATPSFPTNVGNWSLGSGQFADRVLKDGDLISYDIGAEYAHYTSDFGRTIPVSGHFTAQQRRLYDVVAEIQKTLIASVKPGGSFAELQALKDRLVADAGLASRTVNFGISHYVGMEVHDVGDYEVPFAPHMCFVIEWRVETDGLLIRFEDVVLVTQKGHEWLTESAPIDADDYERIMVRKPSLDREP